MTRKPLPNAEPPDNTGEDRRLYAEFDANTMHRIRVYQSLGGFPPMVWVRAEEGEHFPLSDQPRFTLKQAAILRNALTQFLDESTTLGWDIDGIWHDQRKADDE